MHLRIYTHTVFGVSDRESIERSAESIKRYLFKKSPSWKRDCVVAYKFHPAACGQLSFFNLCAGRRIAATDVAVRLSTRLGNGFRERLMEFVYRDLVIETYNGVIDWLCL